MLPTPSTDSASGETLSDDLADLAEAADAFAARQNPTASQSQKALPHVKTRPYSDDQLPVPRHKLPRHVAIIMDGNGRWANQRFWPRVMGHRRGARTVSEMTEECARLGLEQLTLFAFSSENWKRPAAEVGLLMRLFRQYLLSERNRILDNNIRLVVIGRRDRLPPWVASEMATTVALSAANTGMTLCLAVDYGGRDEIVAATRALMTDALAGRAHPDQLDEAAFAARLATAAMPDPDLLIRTAGEMRISNFLLWQLSYSEIHVCDVCWPDFTTRHLHHALIDYAARQRRFGAVAPTAVPPLPALSPAAV